MTYDTIVDAITITVDRYAGLLAKKPPEKITAKLRPYVDLGMDSLHDLNISCEVEAILGVPLPKDHKLLATEGRALSIEEAAKSVAKHLGILKEVSQ